MIIGIPHALRSTRLPGSPAAVWARVCDSRFVAAYLGIALPDAPLEAGRALHGRDAVGRELTLMVVEASAPTALALRLHGADGDEALSWSIAACEGGCRMTVLHGPADADEAMTPSQDAVLTLLSQPLPAVLLSPRVGDAAALVASRAYLADSARAVQGLLDAMPAREGYRRPAPERFSLVEHLWHLADIEQLGWTVRLERTLAEHGPVLAGVDGDRLAIEQRYQQRPWRGAARRFLALRRRSLAILARFDESMLLRPLRFAGRATDAGEVLAAMLAHDHEHRIDMAALWAMDGREQRSRPRAMDAGTPPRP